VTQFNPYGSPPQAPPAWAPAPNAAYPQPYPQPYSQPTQPYPQPTQPYWQPQRGYQPAPPRGGKSGRRPVIALIVVVALLIVGGLVSSAMSDTDSPAAPPVRQPVRTAPAAKAPATAAPKPAATTKPLAAAPKAPAKKPAAKPAPAPVTWVEITKANSGTAGASYQIAAPKDYTFERGTGTATAKEDHLDLYLTDGAATVELGLLSYAWEGLPNGTLPPALVKELRKGWLTTKGRVGLPGTSIATVGGIKATGFDYTKVDKDGTKMRARLVFFGHGGTLHTAIWFAPADGFAATVPTFQHIVATLKFTGTSTRQRPKSATT
jgi:hypothetical protein